MAITTLHVTIMHLCSAVLYQPRQIHGTPGLLGGGMCWACHPFLDILSRRHHSTNKVRVGSVYLGLVRAGRRGQYKHACPLLPRILLTTCTPARLALWAPSLLSSHTCPQEGQSEAMAVLRARSYLTLLGAIAPSVSRRQASVVFRWRSG